MADQYTTLTRMTLFALAGLFVNIQTSRAADDCITKPNAIAPPGSHWYYRVDRSSHRECWYLGPEGREVRTHAHPDGSPARSHPSNTMSTQPQTPTPAEKAEAPGDGPLAAEPVLVETVPGQSKTTEATRVGPLAAEPVFDTAPSQAKTVVAAATLRAELVPDEITPSQMTEINSTASAIRGSAIPRSNLSIDPTLVSTRDGHAKEQSEDERKSAGLSAAKRPFELPILVVQLSVVFAIWLGLAALINTIFFRPAAIRKRAHQKAQDHRGTSIRRRPFKGTRTRRDPALDFESNVRLLLQEFQRRQKCSRLQANRQLGAKLRFAPI